MDMIAVDFQHGAAPAAAQEQVAVLFQRESGAAPPAGYAAFAAQFGGTRFPSNRRYIRNPETGEDVGVGTVYHYDARIVQYFVQDVWSQTRPQLPFGLVPFASSEFGGEVCFDYRAGPIAQPPVVLYDYEAVPGREVTRLADDFRSFLARIGQNSAAG
jgi:hypothetical protein